MLHWVPYPFLRLTPAFLLGIVGYLWGPALPTVALQLTVLAGILLLILAAVVYKTWPGAGLLGGLAGLLGLMACGWLYTQSRTALHAPTHLTQLHQPISHLAGVVVSAEEERNKTWRTRIAVEHVRTDSGWTARQGTTVVYQRKDSLHVPLRYGDAVVLAGSPQRLNAPRNPQEFDYRGYLAMQQVHHQVFTSGTEVQVVGYAPPSWLKAIALQAQQAFRDRLAEGITGQRERAIVWALVLGVKDGLDPATRQAYATAGAMHVLAVSGLHVGIVYAVCLGLLGGLRQRPLGRWMFAAFSLLLLWGFAFLTGLSPSVLRAATMFSFMILAQTTHRKTNTYNTLAASAFLLLCVDPYLIASVGFQLSYLAVLGIVYLQPRMYAWWSAPNRVLDWVWQLTTVSLAAQLATGPLSVYYFHVFPSYFFLSNLLVVPLATVILVGGLGVLGLSTFSAVAAKAMAQLLEWIIWAMNEAIFALEKLPGSRMEDLVLSPTQLLWLVVGLLAFIAFWERRRFRWLGISFTALGLWIGLGWHSYAQQQTQTGLTVYHAGRESLSTLYRGRTRSLLWAESSADAEADFGYQIQGFEQQKGFRPATHLPQPDSLVWQQKGPWRATTWQGKSLLWLQAPAQFQPLPNPIAVDFLIISHNALGSLAHLPEGLTPGQLVLDSSNKSYIAARLQAEAEARHWACHSVPEAGAFTANW